MRLLPRIYRDAIAVICLALIATVSIATAAQAETDAGARVSIELNTMQSDQGGCTLTFLVQNGHGADISKAVYETVLFNTSGQVDRLTLLDFGALPSARPRVRQFVIPALSCDALSQILFNGVETCDAPDLGAEACEDALDLRSRIDAVEVTG